ncbi:biopolymer transporter ExbD [filamentous cyanobacterium LEGE 11480]|uniref:Biopolymer transporter ExbD n=1 Tax=Romeriopsis navalis LEGE 11480 TaxID=2777977 RepID=A0A928VW84_9CYAN|nr:biopolymer transporter ExbD [Romeriopsis navalis]MBE9033189.1 biopolymer transporter ExbD [Romeriopsis navalis LEGE 11480]
MRLPDEPDLPAQINLVPMVDIVFALLTFFIMSSLVLTRSEGLPINLPQANTAKVQTRQQVVVTIGPAGKLSVNKTATSLGQLVQQIQALLQNNQSKIVVINADAQVNHGTVVAVMDQVRKIQGARLAIATQQPQKKTVK